MVWCEFGAQSWSPREIVSNSSGVAWLSNSFWSLINMKPILLRWLLAKGCATLLAIFAPGQETTPGSRCILGNGRPWEDSRVCCSILRLQAPNKSMIIWCRNLAGEMPICELRFIGVDLWAALYIRLWCGIPVLPFSRKLLIEPSCILTRRPSQALSLSRQSSKVMNCCKLYSADPIRYNVANTWIFSSGH